MEADTPPPNFLPELEGELCPLCTSSPSEIMQTTTTIQWIYCEVCEKCFHGVCVGLSNEEVNRLGHSHEKWYCQDCVDSQPSISSSAAIQNDETRPYPCPKCGKSYFTNRGLKIHISKKHPGEQQRDSCFDDLPQYLAKLKSSVFVLKRVPKGARNAAASKLTKIVEDCVVKNDTQSWIKLLTFPFLALRMPNKREEISLTKYVKQNVTELSPPTLNHKKRKQSSLAQRVMAKCADGDIKGSMRLLSSNDSLASVNNDTVSALLAKHPPPSRQLLLPEAPDINCDHFSVDTKMVLKAISSFPSGSAAGIDGLSPQHLKDLTSKSAGAAGEQLLRKITDLINLMLSGQVNQEIRKILFGASLCALNKKDGGIRPIAIGGTLRRLASKICCLLVQPECTTYFQPHQLGFGTKKGCEVVVHTARTYLQLNKHTNKVFIKIDYKNAFNSVERDSILHQVYEKFPKAYPYFWQSYSSNSHLFFGDKIIESQVGAQQGDPVGPMAFNLAIHPIIEKLTSELNLFYLDDGILADSPEILLEDIKILIEESKKIGLEVNPSKCEVFFLSEHAGEAVEHQFRAILPGIKTVVAKDLKLLGVPLLPEGYEESTLERCDSLKFFFSRLKDLPSHVAFFLLKNCIWVPKMLYALRTTPTWDFPDIMDQLDLTMKNSLEAILNISINEKQWTQAALPVKHGGLGTRKLSDLSLPTFIASCFGCRDLISNILNYSVDEIPVCHLEEALDVWRNKYDNMPPVVSTQKNWDNIVLKTTIENLPLETTVDQARFKALQQRESGAWLQCIPSKNIGTFLDDMTLRICISLRLGLLVCHPFECTCGEKVEENGIHPLSCSRSAGRISRHAEINDILKRALVTINIPSLLEPAGLSRSDGKRPDGVTLVPWSKGERLLWDVTFVDTLAPSHLNSSSKEAASAAEAACKSKHSKYAALKNNYAFVAFGVETMGAWSNEAKDFVNTIGSNLILKSGDPRSKQYLTQRISMAIQRGNAASVLGSFPPSIPMDEIFYHI